MYQKDYILRMIEMIRELIMGILGLIRKGDFEHAEKQIENLYSDFLKEDSAFFSKIPVENLTHKLLEEHNYTNGHLEILAWLLDTQAELERSRGNNKMFIEYSQKALILFEFLDNEQKTYSSERLEKIEGIKKRIGQ
jgi:hypothetical protein